MKIAIIHHDIEPTELKFKELFEKKKCIVDLIDIRSVLDTSGEQFLSYDLVLNRVYSSVASRDFDVLIKILSLLRNLEINEVKCINSFMSSLADYSKYELFKILSSNGIPTPPSIFVGSVKHIKNKALKAIKEFGFPIVIKRNCGGKSYDVTRVSSLIELISSLNNSFKIAGNQGYKGGFLLQKFIKSIREHDCRVGIIEGEYYFSYARSLISRNSKDKWMSSTSSGSNEFDYSANKEEIETSLRANLVLGASLSESDVMMTIEGPFIIEVNLTPGYFMDCKEDLERMKLIVNKLIENNLNKKLIKVKAYR